MVRPVLVVSLGDSAGIGPEIIAGAWARRAQDVVPPFCAVGRYEALAAVWDGPIACIAAPEEACDLFDRALPLIALDSPARTPEPGRPTPEDARDAWDALNLAIDFVNSARASALTTGPVTKKGLYDIGFEHPGQTEYLAARCGRSLDDIAMLLVGGSLRVAPATLHVPLRDVADLLTSASIMARARTILAALRQDFGLAAPRLAISGLNPHAGENGALGREDIDIIAPACATLRDEGHAVLGPLAADSMFHAAAQATYDAALCMYHDQALAPFKALHFHDGVNMTIGLPWVRTSPDHGVAFALAGQNCADPGAMIAALKLAAACAARRASG